MTGREKLIELLSQNTCPSPMFCSDNCKYVNSSDCAAERCADHLLANGVIVVDTNSVKRKNLPLIQQAFNMPLDELAELVDAKQSGKIVELPCKVGDTIYTKYKCSFKVESIDILKDKKVFRCGNDGTDDYTAFYEDEIGTEVFLTREEMEKTLAKETAQMAYRLQRCFPAGT